MNDSNEIKYISIEKLKINKLGIEKKNWKLFTYALNVFHSHKVQYSSLI